MSEFKREDRYAVIKYKKLTDQQWTLVPAVHDNFKGALTDCVVIEADWPEYNFVWLMLEHRMAGYPVPDFNAVKCAADVAVAESQLAALREELADLAELKAYVTIPLRERCAERKDLQQRLADAERRNAELFNLLEHAYGAIDENNGWKQLCQRILAVIQPDSIGINKPEEVKSCGLSGKALSLIDEEIRNKGLPS